MKISRWVSQCLITTVWLLSNLPVAQASGFDPPPGQGEPGSTAGGASRPLKVACLTHPEQSDRLTLLAPKTYLGLTTQARPSVWVYLPATRAKTLEFSLFDQQRRGIYQTQIAIANLSGLIQVKLPETAPELSLNQSYSWTIALICNSKRRTEDWVANGWIQRQAPSELLQKNLKLAPTEFDRVLLYRQSQFWYDAIALLLNSPQTARTNQGWTETVKAAGLPQIADPRIQKTVHR
jgi:hypothetical protein